MKEFTVLEIKELMDAFHKNNLGSMSVNGGNFELKLESAKQVQAAVGAAQPAAMAASEAMPAERKEAELSGSVMKSPIVGTFYASPAPDKPPYVSVGAKVKKGDVLFIIESMKLMNEVTSELDGTVSKILVENASPVEYGQPILTIE